MEIKNERQFTLKRIALLKNFKNKVLRKQRKMPFPAEYARLEKTLSDLIDFEVKEYLKKNSLIKTRLFLQIFVLTI